MLHSAGGLRISVNMCASLLPFLISAVSLPLVPTRMSPHFSCRFFHPKSHGMPFLFGVTVPTATIYFVRSQVVRHVRGTEEIVHV
jgi:hypothetical protein